MRVRIRTTAGASLTIIAPRIDLDVRPRRHFHGLESIPGVRQILRPPWSGCALLLGTWSKSPLPPELAHVVLGRFDGRGRFIRRVVNFSLDGRPIIGGDIGRASAVTRSGAAGRCLAAVLVGRAIGWSWWDGSDGLIIGVITAVRLSP
ncbi:MAG: hypothetical protein M1816_006859 [Peltula sp. TS41687]|nr:MAG: hypothetical protein M1816_006859 [Peltula sp. TS41687]